MGLLSAVKPVCASTHYSGTATAHRVAWRGDVYIMATANAKVIGKGLLQQPVKKVNDVTKLLKLVAAGSDEVQYPVLHVWPFLR